MMNNDMLASIEYLRERADVSYEDAEKLLETYDGNVMRALVELEHQGRVYGQATVDAAPKCDTKQRDYRDCEGMKKTRSFFENAMKTRLIVEKKDEDKANLVANLPVPVAVAVAVCAPWLTVATAGLAVVTGHNVRIEKEETSEKKTA